MGLHLLASPQDLCDFSNHLIVQGGVAEAVGSHPSLFPCARNT